MKAILKGLVLAVLASLLLAAPAAAESSSLVPSSAQAATRQLQPWPVLRQGSNSLWPPVTVRSLQYLLNAHGSSRMAPLAVDGVFGPRTNAAVLAFQSSHGLTVDGVVGRKTWSAVIVTVQRGSTGPAVRAVQDQVNSRNLRGDGPPTLVNDGLFGPRTDAWVRAFQANVGDSTPIGVDGIVGPLTWQALISGAVSG